eukprot:3363620-Lingulodinium_polyedra.AAC.1
MGMTTSAAWAQALTEVIGLDAQLPPTARLVADAPPPVGFPVWGSIEDDFWVIEEEDSEDDFTPVGPQWLRAVVKAWRSVGVESHPAKEVDARSGAEVQGAWIDPEAWCGLSRPKRWLLVEAGLRILAMPRARVRLVE